MKADAPGKLVISGAYGVLRGAPALVSAVSRRVYADGGRKANFPAPEVEALRKLLSEHGEVAPAPWYDASELRGGADKLGLGSSAAICAASAAILWAAQQQDEQAGLQGINLPDILFPLARTAHRLAQGGGSGIDVAAACFGGTLAFSQTTDVAPHTLPSVRPVTLPTGLIFEVWKCEKAAETKDLVRRVFACETSHFREFEHAMAAQVRASERAFASCGSNSAAEFVQGLREQVAALRALGDLARVPIVLPEIVSLNGKLPADSVVLPSGAGGGDVHLYVGPRPLDEDIAASARALGLSPVPLFLGAPGVRLYTDTPPQRGSSPDDEEHLG